MGSQLVVVTCITCHGRKKYRGSVCPLCEGRGKIEVIEGDDDDD